MGVSKPALAVRAPAKINLTLDVMGQRDDGYHSLRSLMQTLELHDTIELRPAPDLSFDCDVPELAGEDNLVPRAARLLREAAGHLGGASMVLRKRIPVAAGLGGGSTDAAATLRGLNDLWHLNWATERLAELGADVGSDVPFFFYAPTALVSGRGEVVERVPPLARAHVVLLHPATGVSTGRVFAELPAARYSDGTPTTRLLEVIARGAAPDSWPLSNGLQAMVTELYPEVASALQRMYACGAAQAIMTGSGSTVYSLFARLDEARRVHDCLRAAGHFSILTRMA